MTERPEDAGPVFDGIFWAFVLIFVIWVITIVA